MSKGFLDPPLPAPIKLEALACHKHDKIFQTRVIVQQENLKRRSAVLAVGQL